MKKALVNLEHISKSYDGQMILDDLNLYIRENEFLTLLGPSGCGKTTTLRILGGFETPDAGKVYFNGEDITQLNITERAKRGIAYAFQQPVRFKGLSVQDLLDTAAGTPAALIYSTIFLIGKVEKYAAAPSANTG